MRLIDADHLKRWIIARWEETAPRSEYPLKAIDILDQIDGENTIDAMPVKHGHWIPTEQTPDFEWECSVCGNGFTNNKLSYCYDCGAKMDEVEE